MVEHDIKVDHFLGVKQQCHQSRLFQDYQHILTVVISADTGAIIEAIVAE